MRVGEHAPPTVARILEVGTREEQMAYARIIAFAPILLTEIRRYRIGHNWSRDAQKRVYELLAKVEGRSS